MARAMGEVKKLLGSYEPTRLPEETKGALTELMSAEAKKHGMSKLPSQD